MVEHQNGVDSTMSVEELGTTMENLSVVKGMPTTPDEVLHRCQVLLQELLVFANYCEVKKDRAEYRQKCEYKHFRGNLELEIKQMEKVRKITMFHATMLLSGS